jgi:hypothetical protein
MVGRVTGGQSQRLLQLLHEAEEQLSRAEKIRKSTPQALKSGDLEGLGSARLAILLGAKELGKLQALSSKARVEEKRASSALKVLVVTIEGEKVGFPLAQCFQVWTSSECRKEGALSEVFYQGRALWLPTLKLDTTSEAHLYLGFGERNPETLIPIHCVDGIVEQNFTESTQMKLATEWLRSHSSRRLSASRAA